MESLSPCICVFSCEPSFVVTEAAMTGRETPHARPSACLDGTKTYGTFLSSASRGRWRRISRGSASAAMTTNSEIPRLSVLVASFAPFFSCLYEHADATTSRIVTVSEESASGYAFGFVSAMVFVRFLCGAFTGKENKRGRDRVAARGGCGTGGPSEPESSEGPGRGF